MLERNCRRRVESLEQLADAGGFVTLTSAARAGRRGSWAGVAAAWHAGWL